MGLSEERMVHLEVVTKLTMGDFTHSQLTDNLPEKPGISELTGENISNVLNCHGWFECPLFIVTVGHFQLNTQSTFRFAKHAVTINGLLML